ncbi:C1-like protein [Corchorus olitorius]|uniref:C1-like protein n=1 Tax=Corchorus olitorius TaxID=93759 RepID=A0A1R3JMZ8_9ROSI|nr:C1-like protein [Corchorus olitorius]
MAKHRYHRHFLVLRAGVVEDDSEEMSEEEEDIDKEELGEEEEDIDKKELGEEEEVRSVCNEIFEGPFYRCVECGINFHLKCVPVPQIIKSKCHFHPLTLKDSFVEDDSGEHYCDVCEEERHPKDHVYCCDECEGLFVAHIECALPMMEETSQARRSISLMEPEFGESSIQAERQELIFHEAKDNSV